MKKKFSIHDRVRSFSYAIAGIREAFTSEHNMWIHSFAALSTIVLGVFFEIPIRDWCILCLAIGLVFMAEIFNTAIEHICNLIQPKYDTKIKVIKDLAAGAVLVISIASLAVGVLIFLPKCI